MNHWSMARKMIGRLAAPAMRVAVMIIFLMQQGVAGAQFVQHGFVGIAFAVFFQDGFAEHFGGHLLFRREIRRVGQPPSSSTGEYTGRPLARPEIVVVLAVAGGDVHKARTGVGGHESAGNNRPLRAGMKG